GLQQQETEALKGTGAKLRVRRHELGAVLPLQLEEGKKWKLLLTGESEELGSRARFAGGRPLPNTLWDVGAGLSHTRSLSSDRTFAASFLIGSSGDAPFAAARDLLVQGNLVYKVPSGGGTA